MACTLEAKILWPGLAGKTSTSLIHRLTVNKMMAFASAFFPSPTADN
jgi:hypothetical protein